MFGTAADVTLLPALISEVGRRFIPCQFISMWLYEPKENVMVNLVARQTVNDDARPDVLTGQVHLPVIRGEGKGFLENLSADVVDGASFENMPPSAYIINDRGSDARCYASAELSPLDTSGLRSELYAPMLFHGFRGMLNALNHVDHAFSEEHYALLHILANKAAIAVWNLQERQRADAVARLALLGQAIDLVRHEMQVPLTVIKGATHVLMRRVLLETRPRTPDDDRTLREMVEMIGTEVEKNITILQQIREYCQPVLKLSVTPEDLNALLRAHEDALRVVLRGHDRAGVALRYTLADSLPAVPMSTQHTVGILRNLVRNAAEVGAHDIEVQTELVDGDQVRLSVLDDGGGVDDRTLETLFVPYESSKLGSGGSGLGLFLCRRIVEEGYGGTIRAQNFTRGDGRRGLRVDLLLPSASATSHE